MTETAAPARPSGSFGTRRLSLEPELDARTQVELDRLLRDRLVREGSAAELARKYTTPATSSAVTRAPPGVRARIAARAAVPSGIACHTSVSTAPAETVLTVMPFAASSTAR